MKKAMIGLVLVCAAMAAQAESWVMVQESDTGARLFVDVDTFQGNIKGDDGTAFVGAVFKFFDKGEAGTPTAFLTEASSCKGMNGLLTARKWDGSKWATTNKYWWAKNGGKMYDSAGELLCGAYNQIKSKSGDATPQKPATGKSMI